MKIVALLLFTLLVVGCNGDNKQPPSPPPSPLPTTEPIPSIELTPAPTVAPTPISTPVGTPAVVRATPFPTPKVDPESYLPPITFGVLLTILLAGFWLMKTRTRGRVYRETR